MDLAKARWAGDAAAIDSTYVKAHRAAHCEKGGRGRKALARRAGAIPPRFTPSPMSSATLASSC